ncbi:MAG: ribosome-associated translation inhibitor RaiA [Bacteroidia bacterium]|nr:ribosome-associated translation inhibitor RaiA [Bacteroidia bacterium]MCZ2276447.1 ribosome-associated translation inhibitor RaiA [Bacteroidia bacterium]
MEITIQAIRFKVDNRLADYIKLKAEKLTNYFNGVKSCDVFLRVDSAGKPENKIVEIKLLVPGKELFAKEQCSTFEEATDLVMAALQKQVVRHKGKIRRGM